MINKHSCYLCESTESELLFSGDRFDNPINNYICTTCGFVSILPRPTLKELTKYYQEGDFSKEGRNLNKPNDAKIAHSEKYAFDRINILNKVLTTKAQPSKVLEIGCGIGSFLYYCRAQGSEVYGIEPDKNFAQAGNELYNIEIGTDTIEDFETTTKFNLICSFHVIEHVIDPNSFLTKIHSLLEDDGLIFLECPSIDRMYGNEVKDFFWNVHLNSFSDNTLKGFLIKNKFKILKKYRYKGFIGYVAQKTEQVSSFDNYSDKPQSIKSRIKNYKNTFTKKVTKHARTINAIYSNREIYDLVHLAIRKKGIEKKISLNQKYYKSKDNKFSVLHIGFHRSNNAGDTSLFKSIEHLLRNQIKNIAYRRHNLHQKVTESTVRYFNKFDLIVVGGGGLFLKDTNANATSGWQWPCPEELYAKIKAPIVLFAVGYNRFRNQSDFSDAFYSNIRALHNTSRFWGIRNKGSLKKVNDSLSIEGSEIIRFQPCVTTFLSTLLNLKRSSEPRQKIGLNIAYDRHHKRYGDQELDIFKSICAAIKKLQSDGYTVDLINHVNTDARFNLWLKGSSLQLDNVNLQGTTLNHQIKTFQQYDLIIGTRGHAQMIPFGVGTPIFSLISHDKLGYFLEDIERPEWGVEIHNPNLSEAILNRVKNLNIAMEQEYIYKVQQRFMTLTKSNLEFIKSS
jgi:2-polyprenyl-3-methyl-5-hydroxy-6-metoxy-1,4-benzoquinol methylase/polysaccharide pyruvyl transferase WcaK-like protein